MGETFEELDAREARFRDAKRAYEFYDTGLGRLLPDRLKRMQEANAALWENCFGPARTRKRRNRNTND